MFRTSCLCSAAALAAALWMPAPAMALSQKECGAKYQAAKKADTLKGMKWNAFQKAECADEDVSDADAAAAETEEAAPAKAATQKTDTSEPSAASKTTANPPATTTSGKVVFPTAVSSAYADEKPGVARMHTCRDQWRANKAAGGNGDLKFVAKGGYWPLCNAKLKENGGA